mgnify:CR=1 FL=1
MQKEELISVLGVRMVWKRNIDRLDTDIVIIHISNKHANLHWTFIHIARCVCERCQIMDTYEECLWEMPWYCINFRFKEIKMHNRIWWILGAFLLTNNLLEISMYDFVDRDHWTPWWQFYWTNTWIMIAHARCK